MTTGNLPFFVAHGDAVWLVLLVLLVAATVCLINSIRTVIVRRRARARVAARAAAVVEGERIVVRGKLIGEAVTFSQGEYSSSWRSDELSVEREGQRIAILGDVVVEHGARESSRWFRAPKTAHPVLVADAKSAEAMMLRSLRAGDEVVVCGLRGTGDHEDSSYREPGARAAIVAADQHPITVSAVRPAGKPAALGMAWGPPLLAISIAWFMGLRAIGTAAIDRMGGENRLSSDLGNFDAVSIAAAMPASRREALQHLEYETRMPRSDASLRLAVGFAEYRGECPSFVFSAIGRYEEALAVATGCGNPADVATHLAILGRYDEAAAILPRDDRSKIATTIAIATGRWRDAALGAESWARQEAMCLGALMRTFGGEAGDFASGPEGGNIPECQLLKKVTLPDEQQVKAIGEIEFGDNSFLVVDKARALWRAAGGASRHDRFDGWRLMRGIDAKLWFAPHALAAYRGDDAEVIRRLHAELSALAIARGDFGEARAQHRSAVAHGLLDPEVLEMAIQLHDGSTVLPPHEYKNLQSWRLAEPIFVRFRQNLSLDDWSYTARCDNRFGSNNDVVDQLRFIAAIRSAQTGDGARLLAFLDECRISMDLDGPVVLAVLPLLRTHRREIAASLKYQREDGVGPRWMPFRLINELVYARDIARMLGDGDEAKRIQEVISRHVAVLSDRRKLTALLFWAEPTWR